MGFISSLLGILGFGIGIPIGLLVGYFLFIYFEPTNVKDPIVRPLQELDSNTLLELLNELPLWVKNPDYDRVDWLNRFIFDLWPYLDKGICGMIRSTAEPIFSEYIGKFMIKSIDFECLTLGTLPPTIHGVKVYETNEKELVLEPVIRWAGNPNITLVVKLLSVPITVQLVDLQIFATPRVSLKPLVPTFPCFSSIAVSLMEKSLSFEYSWRDYMAYHMMWQVMWPEHVRCHVHCFTPHQLPHGMPHVDFGLKVLGGDIMAIPGLYRYVQETIRKQVASLYLWPQILEIPILDSSVGATKKPVGILHVKIVRALKLLKMDFLGTSDPYVVISLSGERLPPKKTTIKMKNLNPEWNEEFKLIVKDPESQVLELHVNDWEKVGTHDKLGMQVIPLRLLVPQETKPFTLDLVKNMNPNDPHNMKHRGKIMVELTFNPFREDTERFSGPLDGFRRKESDIRSISEEISANGAGLLSVTVQAAEDVEGKKHNNPYALILFRGEQKKTKMIRKTRDPCWDEEFQFMLEEAPLNDKIHIEVMSKRMALGFRSKESLGHVDINLIDVVNNGRINEKYHLINSKNGMIHVEIRWKTI